VDFHIKFAEDGALPMPPKDQEQKEAGGHTNERSRAHEAGYVVQAPVRFY
jgi:hypothetical protein